MEDEKIIELLYIHNEQGLTETKIKYDTLLNSISYKILRNYDDAQECVNDTYLKTWEMIPPYKPSFLKSFLCKLDRQISIDKYRYNHSQIRDNSNLQFLSDLDYEIADKNNVDIEISKKILIGHLNAFVESLDVESKVLFVHKYFLYAENKEIAKRFKISETNLNVKLFRIRKQLKNYLLKEGYIFE